ncbi:hypothetical protein BKN38_04635 [Helicobacter sp. CLO-3]|uniref:class 1 fructose-bisphosphatase n=1 Tax=unclassified Helicobacter TaxID=2593540 RepID=UPI000805DE32|nr:MULTISPECIES: class 1 fructose-bisphosphatase [unclassified Helicobacter]OBV29826.1 hypothetical protein BA723_04130 [Helicobacter sp. CLO-3]OHU83976.1 hypothetical protein BKN38_04635 [Helicobacter sp. CLO-3]
MSENPNENLGISSAVGAASAKGVEDIYECIKACAIALNATLQTDDTSYLASTNSSGDMQLGIDVAADALIGERLLALECVRGVCSEEKQGAVYKDLDSGDLGAGCGCGAESKGAKNGTESKCKPAQSSALTAPKGGLLVAYDPLDGSSLFDSDLSVGSIFGIYDGAFGAEHIVAAAYVVYGPRLEVVFASAGAQGVKHSFYNGKEWVSKPNLALKTKGKLNAPGGTQKHWSAAHKALIDGFFAQGYRLRYSGGMVPDLHQILCKGGGIFSYPATTDAPNGKLRKLFEVFPFALIYEKAGGEAIAPESSGACKRVLELKSASLHESTPCFLGSSEEIAQVRAAYASASGAR